MQRGRKRARKGRLPLFVPPLLPPDQIRQSEKRRDGSAPRVVNSTATQKQYSNKRQGGQGLLLKERERFPFLDPSPLLHSLVRPCPTLLFSFSIP